MYHLKKRNGVFHFRMRVPARYAHVDHRTEITKSLKTSVKREALHRAALLEAEVSNELERKARLTGSAVSDAGQIEEDLTSIGLTIRSPEQAHGMSAEQVVATLKTLQEAGVTPESNIAEAAILGVEGAKPTIMEVAKAMPEKFSNQLKNKSDRQRQTWKNRWLRPAKKLIKAIGGDMPFEDLTRNEALTLRERLLQDVEDERLRGKTAAKEVENLDNMWNRYFMVFRTHHEVPPGSPFANIAAGLAEGDEHEQKKEVPLRILESFVQTDALSPLPDAMRDIIFILIETGARQSEITDLSEEAIVLKHEIPHLDLHQQSGEHRREVKNKSAKRLVPLVGVALEAAHRNPKGFELYYGNGRFSGEANKLLRKHNLLPPGVTIGGTRHSFETRLRVLAKAPNDDRAELFGHDLAKARGRSVYGDKMSLEEKLSYHNKIKIPKRPAA